MARSKAKPAEQEQLPALNGEVLTATQNAMAATLASHSDERDLLNQLLGQAQMAGAFEEFSRTVRTSKLAYVKENKLYKAIAGKKAPNGSELSGTWEEFCSMLGISVDKADMDITNLRAFGEEALGAGVKRNATVAMKSDGVLLRLAKPDFEALLKAPLLHRLSRSAAEARVAAGQATWLDVRYPVEFAQDGLPGAINVPLNEIRSAYGILDAGREYIVYCQSGRRSSAAAFLLAQHGFSACCLEGGLAAFVESSL